MCRPNTNKLLFLGVHITNKLTWSKHTKTVVKRERQNLFPLRRLKSFGMGPQILSFLLSFLLRNAKCKSKRLLNSFYPQANHKTPEHLIK